MLLERGGLGSVRRILDQFFDRPIIRTAMSEHLREKAKPNDDKAVTAIIESIKSFFTGCLLAWWWQRSRGTKPGGARSTGGE